MIVVELDELLNRPGTYFNPQTEVLVVVDGAKSRATLFHVGPSGLERMREQALPGLRRRLAEHDREAAIDALVSSHIRLAGTGGFATGLGGFLVLPVALPAGATLLVTNSNHYVFIRNETQVLAAMRAWVSRRRRSSIPIATGMIVIAKTRRTIPSMPTSSTSVAPK